MTTLTTTITVDLTPEEAVAELARRAHNRKAKKDASLDRREPASDSAFKASKDMLEQVAAQYEAPATPKGESLGTLQSDVDRDALAAAIERGIAVAHTGEYGTYYEIFGDTAALTCTFECGGCVNGELCGAVVERLVAGDMTVEAYGSPSVAACGHSGECAALAGR